MSHFPVESGKSATFAHPRRLTGGLPDVGKDGVLPRGLIRLARLALIRRKVCLEIAFKAPSLPYQSCSDGQPREYQGIDPDGAKTQGEKRGKPRQSIGGGFWPLAGRKTYCYRPDRDRSRHRAVSRPDR